MACVAARASHATDRRPSGLREAPRGQIKLHRLGPPDFTLSLQPGDVMYLPRGALHTTDTSAAMEGASPSVHLTLGIDSWLVQEDFTTGKQLPALTMPQILHVVLSRCRAKHVALRQRENFVERLHHDVEFRRSMPVSFHNRCDVWMKAGEKLAQTQRFGQCGRDTSFIMNPEELESIVRLIWEEYTKELEIWRTAMTSLATSDN